jgi:hypothetical protein
MGCLYKRAKKDKMHQTDQVIQKELITSSTSSEKLRKFSLRQDWLRQYDKKFVLPQIVLHRKFQDFRLNSSG